MWWVDGGQFELVPMDGGFGQLQEACGLDGRMVEEEMEVWSSAFPSHPPLPWNDQCLPLHQQALRHGVQVPQEHKRAALWN